MSVIATADAPSALVWMGFILVVLLAVAFSLGVRHVTRLKGTRRLKRWVPVVHVAVWAVAVGVVVVGVASYGFTTALVVMVLLLAGLGMAAMDWCRNVVAGVLLFSEGELERGERVGVGDYRGEVVAIGIRSVRLEDEEGVVHDVPHVELLKNPVSRFDDAADAVCEVVMMVSPEADPWTLEEEARLVASAVPWAAPGRRPEVFVEDRRDENGAPRLKIRAHAISPKHRQVYCSEIIRILGAMDEVRGLG